MAAGGAQPAPVVRLSDVTLHYGKTLALNGINLDVPAGKMVGLIGPDGVGKSSTVCADCRGPCHSKRAGRGAGRRYGRSRSIASRSAPALPTCPRGWAEIFIPPCQCSRIPNFSLPACSVMTARKGSGASTSCFKPRRWRLFRIGRRASSRVV